MVTFYKQWEDGTIEDINVNPEQGQSHIGGTTEDPYAGLRKEGWSETKPMQKSTKMSGGETTDTTKQASDTSGITTNGTTAKLTGEQQGLSDLSNFYQSQYDRINSEFENYTKDIEAIDAENSPIIQSIKDTFARRAEETKVLNQAMQGQVALGNVRTGLGRYAPQMATGLVSAETTNGLNRLSELETQKAEAIQKAKDALKSTAKDRWTTFSQYMTQATEAYKGKVQAVIDMHKAIKQEEIDALNLRKTQAETQKLEQEVLNTNLSNYATAFVDFDEQGNVNMADPEELQRFSEESGIPYEQIVGAVRTKAYELSKMSQEDRLRETQITKAQNELIPQLFQEFNYAKQNEGYTGTWQQFLKEKNAAEQTPGTMPTSYKEWQLAGGETGTGKTYAQYIAGGSDMDTKQQSTFMTITNKYQADSLITAGIKGSTAIQIANDVIANPEKAGNQLKILYTLVKNLDPDSAVREGELSLASQTQSYFDKYKTYFDRISKGKLLGEQATKELAEATKQLSENWYQTAQKREQQYSSQAGVAGVGNYFNEYLQGFERPWNKTYTDVMDFNEKATTEEKSEFNSLRQTFPDKTPQEIFEFWKEEKGFNNVGGDTNSATVKEISVQPDGTKGGQCGRFVNKLTGLGVGDSYASKMAKMDKSIKTPEPGMVFVMPYGETGHIGFILSVNNGIATVKDSNYGFDETIKTHQIPVSKMTGFKKVNIS